MPANFPANGGSVSAPASIVPGDGLKTDGSGKVVIDVSDGLKLNATKQVCLDNANVDVFTLKNASAISIGKYRGALTSSSVAADLASASKGDFWICSAAVNLLTQQFNPGDQLWCTATFTGTPANLTNFSRVPLTLNQASSTVLGTVKIGGVNPVALETAAEGTSEAAARADHVHPSIAAATTTTAGLMSSADKTKLNGLADKTTSVWNTATTARQVFTATGSITQLEGPNADKTSVRLDDSNAVTYVNNVNYGGTDSGNKGWSWNSQNSKSSMVLNEASNTIQFLVRAGSGASGKPPVGSNRIWCSDDQSSIEYNVSASSYTRFFCYPDAAVININGTEIARFKPAEVRFNGELYPLTDGTKYLGYNAARWKEIWCTQNSINTVSDQKYKTELQEIPDALLDGWGKFVKWGTYRWLDKNLDQRLNVGLIAQDVIKAFEYAGLDYKDWQVIGGDVDSEYGLSALYGSLQIIENAYHRRRLDRLEAALGKMVD